MRISGPSPASSPDVSKPSTRAAIGISMPNRGEPPPAPKRGKQTDSASSSAAILIDSATTVVTTFPEMPRSSS